MNHNQPVNTNQYGMGIQNPPPSETRYGGGGYYGGSSQHYNQRMPIDPRGPDPRVSNYPPQAGYNNYPSRPGYNMNMGYSMPPNSGYPNYGAYNNSPYPPNPGYQGNNDEILFREAMNKMNFLKRNPKDMDVRRRFEELLKNQYVKNKINEFIKMNKTNQ